MKKKFTILVMALFGVMTVATAQYDAQDCAANLSIFVEHVKVKNYDAAYEPWMLVRKNCPSQSSATYVYGERILKAKIKKATDAEKGAMVKDLMSLYDEWAKFFPTKKGVNQIGKIHAKKGLAMHDFKAGTAAEEFAIYDKAYTVDKASFNEPKGLYLYFKNYYDQYKGKTVNTEDLFNKYEDLSEKFEEETLNYSKKLDKVLKKEEAGTPLTNKDTRNKKVYESRIKAFGIFQGNMDTLIEGESTCENLIPLYKKSFEANKNNAVWLNRAASRMLKKECDDDPLFVDIVKGLDALNPTADSKMLVSILFDKQGNRAQSEKYLKESLDLQTDPYKKAKLLYKIGGQEKKKGRKSSARKYYRQALKIQPSMGRAYLQIAYMIAGSANDCGSTQFEKRATYWKAAEYARRAGKVDPSLKKTTNKLVDSYMKTAPSKTQIFQEKMAGKTIQLKCWVGESVKVPNL